MTIMAFAFADNDNDMFTEDSGNLAIVFDYDCALQSIRQMLSVWLGEYVFNKNAGMPYGAILGTNPDISQAAAEKNIIKILEQNTAQVNKFCVNWNQYLLTSVNGNRLFSDEDYAQYQTTVKAINYIKNSYGHNIMVIAIGFGSGITSNVQINISHVVNSKYRKNTPKKTIEIDAYVPYQPTILCTIQSPADFIINPGHIAVVYKAGGMYSNSKYIMGGNYYDGRILTLELEQKTEVNPTMLENYEIICPNEMNVRVLTV